MPKPSEQFLKFIDQAANKEDVAKLFAHLKKFLEETKTALEGASAEQREEVRQELERLSQSLLEANTSLSSDLSQTKDLLYSESRTLQRLIEQKVDDVRTEIPPPTDLAPLEQHLAEVEAKIPNLPEELSSTSVRDKLETLEGEERLDKSAVKGIDQIERDVKEIQIRPSPKVGGAKGFTLYVGGSKKLLTAQTLNLVAGSGVTLSYNHAGGRNDITISATGSGSFAVLPATGTVNDANTTFTFDSEPVLVIVNGASYRNGAGVSITGTTAELDNPVGTGGDIYGLG